MLNIPPFEFEARAIRVVIGDNGQTWFNANDVCAVLELGNPSQAVKSHVDPEDVAKYYVIDNLGRAQLANHLSNFGLFALILGSNKGAARSFKRWVIREVLPVAITCAYPIDVLPPMPLQADSAEATIN